MDTLHLSRITLATACLLTLSLTGRGFAQPEPQHSNVDRLMPPLVQLNWFAQIDLGNQGVNPVQQIEQSSPENPGSNGRAYLYQGPPPSGRSGGGAGRGNCPVVSLPLTAMVPMSIEGSGQPTPGLTVSDRPTFWFYLPYALTDDRPAEFALLDENGEYLYRTTFTDTGSLNGIIQVAIPATVSPLAANKIYQWKMRIFCGTGDDSIDVWGDIKRILPDSALQQQLEQAAARPRDQGALYAANGLWYEALTRLAELYRRDPNNPVLAADWNSFLKSAGLASFVDKPLLDCCSP